MKKKERANKDPKKVGGGGGVGGEFKGKNNKKRFTCLLVSTNIHLGIQINTYKTKIIEILNISYRDICEKL